MASSGLSPTVTPFGDWTHLALVMGTRTPKTPTLVRVHFADVLQRPVACQPSDSESWLIGEALALATAGQGVVVLLDSRRLAPGS